jgi:hypothetical protein
VSAAATDTLADTARLRRIALVTGVVGVAVCALGLAFEETRVHSLRGWLVAFCFTVGLALGSLVVVMLQYLTGGDWGFLLRRPLEAATRTMPLVTLFYLPVAFGLPYLYDWTQPGVVGEEKARYYLNVPFALTRAVIYFAVWNGLAFLLNRWSWQMDVKKDPAIVKRCETLSAPGLILYVITITFASIDWVMSLEPHWYSTIYGAMFGMGQVLSGFALAVAALTFASHRPPLSRVLERNDLRDLGSLMLAFVMVWAYLSFSQFLLIWSGNLPEEVPWYVYRLHGNWQFVGLALVLFHFAMPFVLLLSTDVKRNRGRLAGVALLLVFMRVVDLLWLIVPAFAHGHQGHDGHEGMPFLGRVMYLAALAGAGGLWLAFYLWQLGRWPLLPEYKPYAEGAAHGAVPGH